MLQRTSLCRLDWKGKLGGFIEKNVLKNVSDPRHDADAKTYPVGYEDFRKVGQRDDGKTVGEGFMKDGESLEEYIARRNARFDIANQADFANTELGKLHRLKDGSIFLPGSGKENSSIESANLRVDIVKEAEKKQFDFDMDSKRKLKMEEQEQYRKNVAQAKRDKNAAADELTRTFAHPSDPGYNPFRNTPSYRPSDSKQLAMWVKRQRESGRTVHDISTDTKEGQERQYQEEQMATQTEANPFARQITPNAGYQSIECFGYSPDSFFLNGKEVIGSCIITATRYYHWNVTTFEDITLKTLAIVLHLYPPPDVCFVGTGRNQYFLCDEIKDAFMKKGIGLECMATKDATAQYGQQLTLLRRAVCCVVSNIPTNPFGRECFGDFVDNDMFSLSDTDLGIMSHRIPVPAHYGKDSYAENYKDTIGTGYGPNYVQKSDGTYFRPGTWSTRLRPLVEPGEDVEWEKLPSFYNWFPKQSINEQMKMTLKDWGTKDPRCPADGRASDILNKAEQKDPDVQAKPPLMPWDSETIPTMKWPFMKNEEDITVEDNKTGRLVGMDKPTFEKWKVMMADRKAGIEPPREEVEFDQERFVTDRKGKMFDLSKTKYIPSYMGRFQTYNPSRSGRRTSAHGAL